MVAAVFLCAGSAGAAEFQGRISAKSAILVDADSGRVLFEIAGVPEETAREALRLASHKLPCKTKIIAKGAESENGGE